MSDVTDDDLRDVFRLLYDGDEWASDGDGEDEIGEAGSGGIAAGDNGTRSKRDAGDGGMEGEQVCCVCGSRGKLWDGDMGGDGCPGIGGRGETGSQMDVVVGSMRRCGAVVTCWCAGVMLSWRR